MTSQSNEKYQGNKKVKRKNIFYLLFSISVKCNLKEIIVKSMLEQWVSTC